jgi:hypothetical protein
MGGRKQDIRWKNNSVDDSIRFFAGADPAAKGVIIKKEYSL